MALRFLSPLIFILVLQQCSAVSDEQKPLVPQSAVTGIEKALQNPAKDGNLHGRFLHITGESFGRLLAK